MYGLKRYKKKRSKNFLLWILVILIMIFLGLVILQNDIKSDDLSRNEVIAVVYSAMENVVSISSRNGDADIWGSGVIVSKKGYILTNEHVSGDGLNCYVYVGEKEKLKADVVWSNSDLDLAIVKVKKEFQNCAYIVDSESIKLGEDVFAIGNPINSDFEKSISKGIISGLNRNLQFEEQGVQFYLTNMIQTDASTNVGNSGGALINSKGQLIGVTTIKIVSSEGMSFAVPADVVKTIIDKLEESGEYAQPKIRASVYDKYTIDKLNLGIRINEGIYVAEVDVNSNAELAGIKVGDVIVQIDDNRIDSINDFRKYIFGKSIGEKVNLKIIRERNNIEISMNLE